MDYKKLAADLLSSCEENCADCEYAGDSEFECTIAQLAATAITELLARAEAAEAHCETLEKMVKEYQDELIPGYRERAEKAEREAKEAQREATLCRNGWKKAERELQIAVGGLVGQCKYCRKNQECTSRKGSHLYCWEWFGAKEE